MVHCVFYTAKKEEKKLLLAAVRDQAAFETGQELDCQAFHSAEEAADYLNERESAIIGWDVSKESGRKTLIAVRERCREAFLLVVAEQDTSPLTFLTPAIAPSSLVIRPLTPSELRRAAKEMLDSLHHERNEDDAYFTITGKNEQTRIPFNRIYYFEARGRKLYARQRGEEIGFTGTLEQLASDLPDEFQRCHRSFIVNTRKIDKVLLAQNLICMREGLSVPLSRSYKRSIKEGSHGER